MVFCVPELSYREARVLDRMCAEFIELHTPNGACDFCKAFDSLTDAPHDPDCEVQVAHDLRNRLSGHLLPGEKQ